MLVLEEATVRPADRFDTVDLYDISDDDEFRRGSVGVCGCKVGRRGGSPGVVLGGGGWVAVRAGGLGGSEGEGACAGAD